MSSMFQRFQDGAMLFESDPKIFQVQVRYNPNITEKIFCFINIFNDLGQTMYHHKRCA